MADALIFLCKHYSGEEIVNVGSGDEVSIAELARLTARVTGFSGDLAFDSSKPDGVARKLVDVSKLNALGWRSSIPFERGVAETYAWFKDHLADARGVAARP